MNIYEPLPDYHDTPETEVAWSLQREVIDLPLVVRFVVDGEPVSKARARFTGKGYVGRAYTPEKTRSAEERIAWEARAAGVKAADGTKSYGVFCKFFCGGWQRRDVDNMTKLVLDGLNLVVWQDDVQVTEISASVQRGVDSPRTHVFIYETLRSSPPTLPCEICGTPVRQYKSQPNRYCSREHAGLGQRIRVELQCAECGVLYELPKGRAERVKTPLCSEKCRNAHQRITRNCLNCGKSVTRPRSWAKRQMFCSVDCSTAFKVGKPRAGGDAA